MKRPELARVVILLVAGAGLVSWLVYATRPEAQVHALETQPAKSTEAVAPVSATQPATESSTTEIEPTPVSNESEPAEIVPAGPRTTARRTPLENVPGPEPLPGLTPAAVLQNMRSAVRDY